MPKKSESVEQPTEASAEEMRGASARKGKRAASGQAAGAEEVQEADAAAGAAGDAAPQEAAGGADGAAVDEKQAAISLRGLRGAEYVKALSGHPLASMGVPLLPGERRGDWARAKGVKIRVTTRELQAEGGASSNIWQERDHALAALVVELERPGARRFDQIDLGGSAAREAIDRLSDYVSQARLRAQAQSGKKWTASQVYLVPVEDA